MKLDCEMEDPCIKIAIDRCVYFILHDDSLQIYPFRYSSVISFHYLPTINEDRLDFDK